LLEKLPNVYRVPNIPHYTKEEADAFASHHLDRHITPNVNFGHIWKSRKSYTLVPLEEGQLKRWTWGRIVCVGDCVHKMTPNMGAGGNAAIE
jgi:2-polyprenyl-6-methoxyphenol hydroxylase-like FAD-dependent oxidoreductase